MSNIHFENSSFDETESVGQERSLIWANVISKLFNAVEKYLGVGTQASNKSHIELNDATTEFRDVSHTRPTADGKWDYTYLLTADEEARHFKRSAILARDEQQVIGQQNQAMSAFAESLEGKNLAELMDLSKTESNSAAIRKGVPGLVRAGRTDADIAMANDEWDYYDKTMSNKDWDRVWDTYKRANIPVDVPAIETSSYSSVRNGEDSSKKLEETKSWLKRTFQQPTDAILITMRDGEQVVVSIGVSNEDVANARAVEADRAYSESRLALISNRIREEIEKPPRSRPVSENVSSVSPLKTPVPSVVGPSFGRDT